MASNLKVIDKTSTHHIQKLVITKKDGAQVTFYQTVPLDGEGKPIYDARKIKRHGTLVAAREEAGWTPMNGH